MVRKSSQGKTETKTASNANGITSSGALASHGNGSTTSAPEAKVQLEQIRAQIQLSVGQIVLLMMNLSRYRSQTLADLSHLVLEPLLRDRISIATARPKDSVEGAIIETLAGVAIWASVSDVVDAKIREQINGGSFPIRLGKDDWASGEKLWLLDVVATDRKLATAVLANFRQVVGARPVDIHPIVARSVEPALLEKLRIKQGGEQ